MEEVEDMAADQDPTPEVARKLVKAGGRIVTGWRDRQYKLGPRLGKLQLKLNLLS